MSEKKSKIAILSIGTRLAPAIEAGRQLEESRPDVSVTVADARFMKPLDIELLRSLAKDHGTLITVEENSIGGFGDHVLHFLALDGLLDDGSTKVRPMVIPDQWIETAAQSEQYDEAGLNSKHIFGTMERLLDPAKVPSMS